MNSRSVIIGIHGLANKPPQDGKARWWRAALLEGLRRNLPEPAPDDIPFDFVYWADLRYGTPVAEAHNREPYYPAPGRGPLPSCDARGANRLTWTDRIYRSIDWLQERTGLTPVDDILIEYRLDDLWGYHEDAAFRAAARARLRDALERHAGARILIVAHSMGALIAYDVLREAERAGRPWPVGHLLTLGAPLGLAEVKLRLTQEHGPLRVPPVQAWTNVMDRADIATVGGDVGDLYAPNAEGVRARDVCVDNAYRRPARPGPGRMRLEGRANRHKSYGYLRTPEVSRAVAAFLDARGAPERAGAAPGMDLAAASGGAP